MLRQLKNGVLHGSVLAPLLFNICINDLPPTTFKLYAYGDDLAVVHSAAEWPSLEKTLNQDMATLSSYLQNWRLKLSKSKTVSTAFHLNNREAKRELNIIGDENSLPHNPTPLGYPAQETYITRHPDPSIGKYWLGSTCNNFMHHHPGPCLLHCLVLRTSTKAQHLLDKLINDALRMVMGCLKPTPTEYLPVLSDISPAELYRETATLSLARQSLEPGHTLHNYFNRPITKRRLKSRKPFVIEAQGLLAQNINAPTWIHNTWKENWTKNIFRPHSFATDVGPLPIGHELSQLA